MRIGISVSVAILAALLFGGWLFIDKYRTEQEMVIVIDEVTTAQYPEDPENLSPQYDRYTGRQLRLVRKDEDHFDFIFDSNTPGVATIVFRNIDLSLYLPIKTAWVTGNRDLEVLTFVEREWNRQQVKFAPSSEHLEITGGDGWEKKNLISAELARNCLNAKLWELLLYTEEEGTKRIYYHGWFDFPLGFYKELFEEHNGTSYWKDWFRLEHWIDPAGIHVDLSKLRQVIEARPVEIEFDPKEAIIAAGEQLRKLRTLNAKDVRDWEDFVAKRDQVLFATFVPPGRYAVRKPWGNEYERISNLFGGSWRRVRSLSDGKELDEVEMIFQSISGEMSRFIVSGFSIAELPQLPNERYPEGFYMPMGISVPPTSQSYEDLKNNPPYSSPYFSVWIDEEGGWINHHKAGIDGVVMHRDETDQNLIHLYLLSYERHTLICHFVLPYINMASANRR